MKKIGTLYMQIFSLVSFISFFWIFIIAVYGTFLVSKISIFIFAGCCVAMFLFGRKIYQYINNEDIIVKVWFALWGLSIVVMAYVAWNLRANMDSAWDYGAILKDAIQLVKNNGLESQYYYARYPNNLLLLFILEKFFKIITLMEPDISATALQSCSIILSCTLTQLSIGLIYITMNRLWGRKKASLLGIVLLVASPLYLYATFAYTDTFSLPLIAGQIYFYSRFKTEEGKKKWISLIIAAVLGAFGFKLKMTVAFVLIAIVIDIFIQGNIKNFVRSLVLICLTTISIIFLLNSVLLKQYKFIPELKERYQFPYEHWVMMSLNVGGGYHQEDVNYTMSFDSYDERRQADIDKIRERIENMGIMGTVRHIFCDKTVRTWSMGSMAGDDYLSRSPTYKNPLQSVLCLNGKYHNIYYVYMQIYHLLMLFWILYYLFCNIRLREDGVINVMVTTVWGLAVFLCIWECNSRYLVQMLPLMVVIMVSGIYRFLEKNKERIH